MVKFSRPVVDIITRLSGSVFGLVGAFILLFLLAVAILAPLISPFSPNEIAGPALHSPGGRHILGTDNIGRDVFSVVVYGTRGALAVGISSALIALGLGATIGGLAAYLGGWKESFLMRIVELFQILPLLILALVIVALWGANFWLIILAMGIAIWPLEARIVYGQVRAIRDREYIQAARISGLSVGHTIFREIVPNAIPPVVVQVTLDAGLAVLIQAGLGFLGLDDPLFASWGQLLNSAQDYMDQAWWMSVFPGCAIAITVLGFALLGDGLNEIFNPRKVKGRKGF